MSPPRALRLPRRFPAATAAVLLALAACSIHSSGPAAGPGGTKTSPGVTGGTGVPGSTSGPGTNGKPGSGASNPGATLPPGASFSDSGPVGGMARAFLAGSPASKLVVEVDYVTGRRPSSAALGHLASILRRECHKSGGISVAAGNEIPVSKSAYSIADIIALERANRSAHSAGATATIWMVYLNGSFAENAGALGLSYSSSSSAIFRDQIDAATTALILATEIERSVVVHEAGHLLALINIGYQSHFDHEDKAHPHHSNSKGSVMYWAVEDVSLKNLLAGGPPDDFDQADRADLMMLRGS